MIGTETGTMTCDGGGMRNGRGRGKHVGRGTGRGRESVNERGSSVKGSEQEIGSESAQRRGRAASHMNVTDHALVIGKRSNQLDVNFFCSEHCLFIRRIGPLQFD